MKFIWKIENFSNLKAGELLSPSFSSHSITWEIRITEQKSICKLYIAMRLICLTSVTSSMEYPKNFSFALLDFKGLPFVWQDGKILDDSYCGFSKREVAVSLTKNIFGSRKTEFLPNDILTVQCHIWNTENELLRPLSIFARSRVESEKVITFEWNISEENLFRVGYMSERVEPIINGEFLTIKLSRENSLKFESKVSMYRCKMEIQIMLLDAMKMRKVDISNRNYNFTKNGETWKFNTSISRNMIMAHQNFLLSDNTITLYFICSFSECVTINRIVNENKMLNTQRPIVALNQISETSVSADKSEETNQLVEPQASNTITQAFQELFKEGLLSDFNLKVKERLFPVHKAILSARSQVFRAMFTTEMKEKEDNFVNIPDVDEDILERLLQFVYSDEFDEEMDWETASCLYTAADKYALEPLKQRCSAVLKSGFCVSNVLEVLMLADLHQDRNLKLAVLDFISLNHRDIVNNEHWSKFEEENAKLALDIFQSLYLKKMKGSLML